MSEIKPPTRFVGLHSHSTFSISDAIGLPQEHIESALANGMDALALTDHGNLNGITHQQIKAAALKKEGRNFKAIPGLEAYFLDSLSDWHILKAKREEEKQIEKINKKNIADAKKKKNDIGNELASNEEIIDEISDSKTIISEEESGGTIVENEEESKGRYIADPLKQRNHLVLLPKNNTGLKSLFRISSESSINGFYSYPRVDFDILRRNANGNIIALSACVSGDALLETNFGLLPLKEVVDRLKQEQELFVLSFDEKNNRLKFEKVINGQLTRRKAKLLKITLANGKTIKVTPEHKVFTTKGWLAANELKDNMPLEILTSET